MKRYSFFGLIKEIFSDITILYRNFIHWNISKVIIGVVGGLLGFAFASPFLLLLAGLMYLDPISWSEVASGIETGTLSTSLVTLLLENFLIIILEILLAVLAIAALFTGWTYSVALQLYLYKNYLEGVKIPYLKNYYFDLDKFKTFLLILLWTGYYVSIPLLVGIVALIVLFVFFIAYFGDMASFSNYIFLTQYNFFTVTLFVVCVITAVGFLYANYRVYFANMLFVDDFLSKRLQKGRSYVQQAIEKTTGWKNLLRLVGVLFIFGMVLAVVSSPSGYVEKQIKEIEFYAENYGYTGALEPEEQEVMAKYASLGEEQILEKYNKFATLSFLLVILYFFIAEGVMEMVVFSFYANTIRGRKVTVRKKL